MTHGTAVDARPVRSQGSCKLKKFSNKRVPSFPSPNFKRNCPNTYATQSTKIRSVALAHHLLLLQNSVESVLICKFVQSWDVSARTIFNYTISPYSTPKELENRNNSSLVKLPLLVYVMILQLPVQVGKKKKGVTAIDLQVTSGFLFETSNAWSCVRGNSNQLNLRHRWQTDQCKASQVFGKKSDHTKFWWICNK